MELERINICAVCFSSPFFAPFRSISIPFLYCCTNWVQLYYQTLHYLISSFSANDVNAKSTFRTCMNSSCRFCTHYTLFLRLFILISKRLPYFQYFLVRPIILSYVRFFSKSFVCNTPCNCSGIDESDKPVR